MRAEDVGYTCAYRIAFLRQDASLDEALVRAGVRGIEIRGVYRGLHAYAFATTEGGMELDFVWRDAATRVVASCEPPVPLRP